MIVPIIVVTVRRRGRISHLRGNKNGTRVGNSNKLLLHGSRDRHRSRNLNKLGLLNRHRSRHWDKLGLLRHWDKLRLWLGNKNRLWLARVLGSVMVTRWLSVSVVLGSVVIVIAV